MDDMTSNELTSDIETLDAHYVQRVNAAVAAGLLDVATDLSTEYVHEKARVNRKRSRR
jgi:hypothetical protein